MVGIADPQLPPVMVNPLEPEPGFPVQAHARRLAELLEAVFGLAGPAAEVIRAGLLRAYADCGWDAVTGARRPVPSAPPAVPAFAQLRHAVLAAAGDLGCGVSCAPRSAASCKPGWNRCGRARQGVSSKAGIRPTSAMLLRGNVLLTGDGLAGDEGASFLAGIVLARVAERLRVQRRCSPRYRHRGGAAPSAARRWPAGSPLRRGRYGRTAVMSSSPGGRARRARRARRAGPGRGTGNGPARRIARPGPARAQVGGLQRPLPGERPCSGYELHAAGLLARDDERAWLRLWAVTLVLAFLAGRPLPRVPAGVLPGWRALSPRSRECVLATVLDGAVDGPRRGAAAVLPPGAPDVGRGREWRPDAGRDRGGPVPGRAGLGHPAAALAARGRAAEPARPRRDPAWTTSRRRWTSAWPGCPTGPASGSGTGSAALRAAPVVHGARPPNRRLACLALLGEDGRAGLDADLATALPGIHPARALRHAAAADGRRAAEPEPGWLEVVLSWPDRIVRPAWDMDLPAAATG